MQDKLTGVSTAVLRRGWSNRILLLATAGILFLTLYPFRFDFHAAVPGGGSPVLLGRSLKAARLLAVFLNVLLFVPFGFGLAAKLRERGKSRAFTFVLALATGALFSEHFINNKTSHRPGCVGKDVLPSRIARRNIELEKFDAIGKQGASRQRQHESEGA